MSISRLIRCAIARWRLTSGIVILCLAGSVVVALVTRPVFRAEVVVAPTGDDSSFSGLGSIAGQLGGLASLAGISIGKGQNGAEALGVLKSRALLYRLVRDKDLMPVLFANRWDSVNKRWRSGRKPPTLGDAVLLLDRDVRQIREDLKSNLLTVRVEWTDRQLAADWATSLVEIANEDLRERAIAESTAMLEVLSRESAVADSVALRNSLASLTEAQLKAKTFAEVRRQYAFKVVDPAVVPDADKRVRPTRTLIVFVGGVLGCVLAALAVMILETDTPASADEARR